MGLYEQIRDRLPEHFSIFQFMSIVGMDASGVREARNILKQFFLEGYITRISKNMYQKKNI
jgi:hypothetical protein